MAENGLVKETADQLGRIFRHLLPGVLILAAARASHPRWFVDRFDWAEPWHLAALGVVAIMAGNTWYVVHRYTVHQLLDVGAYWWSKRTRWPRGYVGWLAEHVHNANLFPEHAQELRQHTLFRSAQVIYLFIIGEVLLVFGWSPAPGTFFARHCGTLLLAGGVVLAFACWQYYLTDRIDRHVVERCGGKRKAAG